MFGRRDVTSVLSMLLVLLLSPTALGEEHEIIFPDYVLGYPSDIAFTHNGNVGVAIGGGVQSPWRLFSFSVAERRVLDAFDLSAELGVGIRSLNLCVHRETGVLTIASFVLSDARQKVVALNVDQAGHFSKLWSVAFATSFVGTPSAIFNEDATNVWVFYKDERPKLALLRSEDGASIATIALPDTDTEALLVFDRIAKRPIVKTGQYIHVFVPESEGFRIEWTGDVPSGSHPMIAAAISRDGRFMFGYGGSSVFFDPPLTTNNFVALDLNTKRFHTLSLSSSIAPAASAVFADPTQGRLFVPYSVKVKIKHDGFTAVAKGSNLIDVFQLTEPGDITQSATVDLTSLSGGDKDGNAISFFNNIALSKSGALGFVSSLEKKRIFSFDTSTGEIVNEISVPDALSYIYRPGNLDVLVYANGTNKLVVVDIVTSPIVTEVQVKRGRTIIKGANFLFGARVQINGEDLGIVDRNTDDPGREIIINRGKKDFPSGQDINIVVINRDGLGSNAFIFRR